LSIGYKEGVARLKRFDPDQLTRKIVPGWSEESVQVKQYVSVPQSFDVLLEHPDWPAQARLSVGFDAERGPFVRGLSAVGDAAVSYTDIHDALTATVDMAVLLEFVAAQAAGVRVFWDLIDEHYPDHMDEIKAINQLISESALVSGATAPHRRRLVTPEHLAQVAATYRQAMAQSRPPTVAVADQFQVSHSTAARWVGAARKSGELGPARGKRPGERPAPKKRSRNEEA
jgi:hypothetical protein